MSDVVLVCDRRRKYEVVIAPHLGGRPLDGLALPMRPQHLDDRSWERDHPPRPPRLGRREHQLTPDPLQR
jgi:hypothetical protein